jgi:hypothetical protein
MKVSQIKCPRCGKASFSKLKDSVIYCEDCRTLHTLGEAGPIILEYEIAEFGKELPLRKFHMPFWRLFSQVTVFSSQVVGGWAGRLLSGAAGSGNLNGTMFIFVPGIELPPDVYKRMAQDYTANPPQYRGAERFGFERLPVIVDELAARKLADFLILSFEAEKPGVLQDIKYSVEVQRTKLIYLPFYQDAEGHWQPGL